MADYQDPGAAAPLRPAPQIPSDMESDYTTVIGVDAHHLRELREVWPTWQRWRPELFERPMVLFHDRSLALADVAAAVPDHPAIRFVKWPVSTHEHDVYPGTPGSRWSDPQRGKMLAGFVHVPATFVTTPYWLKLDVDCVAFRSQHKIVPDSAFTGLPSIIGHPWGYTKPADQMQRLDAWVAENAEKLPVLAAYPPLGLVPAPGATRLPHKRIISFCGFFKTSFTVMASHFAAVTCGYGQTPVPSQDGFHFYVAKRLGAGIVLINMKERGFEHWGNFENLKRSVWRSLNDGGE